MKTIIVTLTMAFVFSNIKAVTVQEVYNYCVEKEVLHPEIVTAQAVLETGWFKCTSENVGCSMDMNNLFGFFYKGRYLSFSNWKKSVDYYKWWQDQLYDSTRDYFDFLTCLYVSKSGRCLGYAERPQSYCIEVKKILKILREDYKL